MTPGPRVTPLQQRVAHWVGLFAERLGRQIAPAIALEFYAALPADLTVEEFDFAARTLFAREKFLPPALEFVFTARPDARPDAVARRALAAIRSAIRVLPQQGNYRAEIFVRWSEVPEELRTAAEYAFLQSGGDPERLRDGEDYGFTQRFTAAFQVAQDAGAALQVLPPSPHRRALPSTGGGPAAIGPAIHALHLLPGDPS